MSDVFCPLCNNKIRDVEELFDDEKSAEADVYEPCPTCEQPLHFMRRVEYSARERC